MKFSSALLVAALASSASAFAPSLNGGARAVSVGETALSAATLKPPTEEGSADKEKDAPKAAMAEPSVAATEGMGVEKDWPVDQENFVKDSDRIVPGRYNDLEKSLAIPFLQRPPKLDGSHAGDYGFDPLGLSDKLDFYAMQESEVRHARLAMLAVVGWPMSELLAPSWLLQENGCAPSVLNGFSPVTFLAVAGLFGAAGFFEYQTSLRPSQSTSMGKMHEKDMSAVWKYGVAGDYNWDPLDLYTSCGDDYKGRKGLRDVEISHGRAAMLGITYFAAWEALTGHPIVEDNMLFHPNLLFPALAAAYVGWGQIYEVSPLDEYPIEVRYTNEGEMKLNRLKKGAQDVVAQVASSTTEQKGQLDELDAKYDIFRKIAVAPKKLEAAVRSTYKYW